MNPRATITSHVHAALEREPRINIHRHPIHIAAADGTVTLEGEVAEDHEAVRVRRIELDRLLRRRLRLLRIDELHVVDLRELRPEAQVALRVGDHGADLAGLSEVAREIATSR